MKAFQLAAVLLIICISSAMALKCNHCVPLSSGRCTNTVETCQRDGDVCAYVISTLPRYTYFKRCMKKSDAFALKAISSFQVFTCESDRCN